MERTPEMKELWDKIEAKRKAYREANPDKVNELVCPFTDDMKCIGGCTDNHSRACVNGDD